MEAKRFFKMLDASRDIKMNELKDAADIAAIPMYTKKYHLELISNFESLSPTLRKAKQEFHRKAMEGFKDDEEKPFLEGVEAHNAVINLFVNKPRLVN
jgi:hypothetical protein